MAKTAASSHDLIVRPLIGPREHEQAFALRHAVYCQRLGWVPARGDGRERDDFEDGAVSLGALDARGTLLGVVRLIPADRPFMLERDFAPLLKGRRLAKSRDCAEVTRLATRRVPGLASGAIAALLYDGIYRWSRRHGVRFLYFVVETRYHRILERLGFPCRALGPACRLGETVCVAVRLDWRAYTPGSRA